jgi:uncharacterized membrane protein SirB2
MINDFFSFFKYIDPLIGTCLLVLGMGLVWVMDIEKSPWMLYLFFIVLMLWIHFGVVA